MYRDLINYLTFGYSMICRGRRTISREDMRSIAEGAHAATRNAEAVLDPESKADAEDRKDLEEARKINEHIEEMTVVLLSWENV